MKTARPRAPILMGILNVTPDSFSDGGKYLDPRAALKHARQMLAQGATCLDLGAESTRPRSLAAPAKEQLRRLLPVLRALRKQTSVLISIDTRSAVVAAACLAEGAGMINDISALRGDRNMFKVLAASDCQIILMHMRGTPRTMQRRPVYKDVVAEIGDFFRERVAFCQKAGIQRSRLWLDPGIGFGKTQAHNLEILRRLKEFTALGLPIAVGVSRKSFLGSLTGETMPERRLTASVCAGILAVERGAALLRVHDVAEHAAALRVAEELRNDEG